MASWPKPASRTRTTMQSGTRRWTVLSVKFHAWIECMQKFRTAVIPLSPSSSNPDQFSPGLNTSWRMPHCAPSTGALAVGAAAFVLLAIGQLIRLRKARQRALQPAA